MQHRWRSPRHSPCAGLRLLTVDPCDACVTPLAGHPRNACVAPSKVMSTPGSPNCSAPLTRKLVASSVLPDPAPPQTRVGRPLGRPPLVISSRPWMPVGALASARGGAPMLGECCIAGRIAQQFADLNATLAPHGRVAVGVTRKRVKTTRQGVFFNACVINFTNSAASCESSERAAQASPRPSLGFGRGMMWK
jgi:hypothetical protein